MNLVSAILACATCFGAADSNQTVGQNWAIVTLLCITGVVLSGFAAMIVYLVRRARRYQAAEEINAQIPNGISEVG